jgi:hypothetical protein
VAPSSTIAAGPNLSTAIGGSPQAIPSTSTRPNCSRTDASTCTSAALRNSGSAA